MAYVTRRSGGGWSRVSSATDYSNVVSNYASVLKQAQEQKIATELETKVFNYKSGIITYQELKDYLKLRLTDSIPGSQKELDIRQLESTVDTYELQNKREITRSQLESRLAKGGLSAAERVEIEQALIPLFKEGTPEYTEQLNVVAQAKELAVQEQKNIRLAQLQSRLSDGGLNTKEQIQILEEAQSMSEKGSKEYADFGIKLAEVNEAARLEQQERRKLEAISELLDEYKDGGLTNEELLQINKIEQEFTDPDSEEAVKLKQAEADLLGAIEKDVRGSGGGGGNNNKAAQDRNQVLFAQKNAEIAQTDLALKQGAISMEEYAQRMDSLLASQEEIASYGSNVGSSKERGELLNRINTFLEQKNAIGSGQAAIVIGKNGERQLMTAQQIMANPTAKQKQDVYELDEAGNLVSIGARETITLDEGGQEVKYLVNDNGSLEKLTQSGEYTDDKGQPVLTRSKTAAPIKFGRGSQTNLSDSLRESEQQGQVLGASTVAQALPVSGASNQSSSSKSSDKKSSSGASSSRVSGIASSKVPSAPKTSVNYAPVVKTVAKTVAKAVGVTSNPYGGTGKILSAGVKKGNIPGTKDYGVTEAISSAAKKAASFLGKLFK